MAVWKGADTARREILGGLRPADLAKEVAQNAARRAGLTGPICWHEWVSPTLHCVEPSSHWRFVSADLRWRMDVEESGFWSATCEGCGEVAAGRVTVDTACRMVCAAWVIALCQARIAQLETQA